MRRCGTLLSLVFGMLILLGSTAEEDQNGLGFIDLVNMHVNTGNSLVVTLFANYVSDFDNFSVVWTGHTIPPTTVLTIGGSGVFGYFRYTPPQGATSCVDVNVTKDPYPNSMVLTAYEEIP